MASGTGPSVLVSVTWTPPAAATSTKASWTVCQATPSPAATRDAGTSQSPTRCPITVRACPDTLARRPAAGPVSVKLTVSHSVSSHQNSGLMPVTPNRDQRRVGESVGRGLLDPT